MGVVLSLGVYCANTWITRNRIEVGIVYDVQGEILHSICIQDETQLEREWDIFSLLRLSFVCVCVCSRHTNLANFNDKRSRENGENGTPKGSIICVYRALHLFINDNADKAMPMWKKSEWERERDSVSAEQWSSKCACCKKRDEISRDKTMDSHESSSKAHIGIASNGWKLNEHGSEIPWMGRFIHVVYVYKRIRHLISFRYRFSIRIENWEKSNERVVVSVPFDDIYFCSEFYFNTLAKFTEVSCSRWIIVFVGYTHLILYFYSLPIFFFLFTFHNCLCFCCWAAGQRKIVRIIWQIECDSRTHGNPPLDKRRKWNGENFKRLHWR